MSTAHGLAYGKGVDVYVHVRLLTFRVASLTVIDFPKANGSDGMHTALVKWVCAYFDVDPPAQDTPSNDTAFSKLMQSKGSPIRIAEDRYPLYLQHQGHSRTIVGVEMTKSGQLNLLLFDPGQ